MQACLDVHCSLQQAASKVASWEVSVQKGTFNDASSGVCVVSSNAEVSEHWAEITLRQHRFTAIAMLCFN